MGSTSAAMKPDVALTLCISSSEHFEHINPEERGILLIQLLLKCAMHAASGNLHRADACLQQISQHASVAGDSTQRLAARFASALAVRLVKRWPGLYKALNRKPSWLPGADWEGHIFGPHLRLAYTIIAKTLTRTMAEERVIHILDTGSLDPELWVPVLHSFAEMPEPPHLKITCISSSQLVLEKLSDKLVKEAEDLAMPFQFSPLNITLRDLTIDLLELRSGEALAIISVLNLHTVLVEDDRVDMQFGHNRGNIVKECKQMSQFLGMMRSMSPKILLLVEQESDHNLNRLTDRFVQGLHYYSAIFDSMNTISSESRRLSMEEMYGREIENIVGCEGLERVERHESYGRWMVRMGTGGFKPVRLWYGSMEGEEDLVGDAGKHGLKVRSERASLMICWNQRPLYAVSAWIPQ